MKTTPQASISIEKAAEMLNMTPEELERFCQLDTGQRFHHLTIFSKKIRFWNRDIIRIRKHLSKTKGISYPPPIPPKSFAHRNQAPVKQDSNYTNLCTQQQ